MQENSLKALAEIEIVDKFLVMYLWYNVTVRTYINIIATSEDTE